MSIRIIGTGSAVPEYVLTNDAASKLVDTSNEWIESRTGIKERRICTTETLSDLAVNAGKAAIEDAGICVEEIDLIICATVRADEMTPSMSCIVQQRIGANCPSFDINAACSGFIFAMDATLGYFARGKAKKALIIAAESMSKLVDWSDRATCVLFGDGAGAIVVEEGDDLLSITIKSLGSDILRIPSVEGNSPFNKTAQRPPYLYMAGQEVFKFAVNSICNDLKSVIDEAGISESDIDFVLLHQANKRIISAAEKHMDISKEKYQFNIDKYGNTSSASIPLLLDELNKADQLKKGDIIAMSAFGGGLTSAACILRWNKQK